MGQPSIWVASFQSDSSKILSDRAAELLFLLEAATSEIQQALLHTSVGAPDTRPATPKEESRPSGTRDDRSDICPDNDDDADVGPDSPEDIRSDC